MKISVITPIYNEEKSIECFFRAINKLDYPKEDFEILLINDGSIDNSRTIMETETEKSNLNVRIINLKKNKGWIIARETGARNAKYDNLLFFDCKCEISPDALLEIKKANYQPLIGTARQKNNHVYDRFFFLIRNSLTKPEYKKEEEFYITKKNFDEVGKGTTIFFCNKDLFLGSQPLDKNNKYVSDDIRLLWNIVGKKSILKTKNVWLFYNTRQTFKENSRHMFSRGPRFADYYYRPNKKMFWLINLIFLSIISSLYMTILKSAYMETALALLVINAIISIFLARTIKDFAICFCLFPILGLIFLCGVIYGVVLKPFYAKH